MGHLTMIRALSCNMRASMDASCVTMRLKHGAASARNPRQVRQRKTEYGGSRFKSSTTSLTRRQQSTVFSSDASASKTLAQQVARPPLKDSLRTFLLKPRTVPVPRWVSPHHYTITLSEVCGHASFILVAVSYAMDDFLELRIIAVAGSTAMLFFTYFHPHGRVLWLPFKWNVLFILINSYRIGNVYKKRFHAQQLPAELLNIREKHFYVLDPEDFYKLVEMGRMETFNPGDLVVAQVSKNLREVERFCEANCLTCFINRAA